MNSLAVPEELEAERALAGGLVAHGLALADLDPLAADDFYWPEPRRIAMAAGELAELPRFYADLGPYRTPADLPADLVELASDLPTRRGVLVAAAAFLADVPAVVVTALVAEAPARSLLPAMAARVTHAAQRRRAMNALADAFNALGSGGSLADVAPLLEKVA